MQQGNESKIRNPKFAIRNFRRAFALYEVLIGVAIFAVGVIALGRAVENCLNASTISAEESAVRQILSDRMAVIQAAPGVPDAEKEFKINSNYGTIRLIQKSAPAELTEEDKTLLSGINLDRLTAQWQHAGVPPVDSHCSRLCWQWQFWE